MLRPNDIEQLKGNNSRYAMVIGVAKRARDIVEHAIENSEILIEKPVSMAIEDFKGGDYKIFAASEQSPAEEQPSADEAADSQEA